jgi:hypothetical protein
LSYPTLTREQGALTGKQGINMTGAKPGAASCRAAASAA